MEDLSPQELRQKVLEAHLHRAPSVGSVVKRIMEINPNLPVSAVMEIVRAATQRRGGDGDFASTEIIDVPRALELAKATLGS